MACKKLGMQFNCKVKFGLFIIKRRAKFKSNLFCLSLVYSYRNTFSEWAMGFRYGNFHLKISPWEEKPSLWQTYAWEASFSSCGLIFEGEEISIPYLKLIWKSYIFTH